MALAIKGRPRGLLEVLPNLLRDKTSLHFKHPELRAYVATLDPRRFHDKAYLQSIKVHMEEHRLSFWKRLDVTITVEPGLTTFSNGRTPQRVLEFYHSRPEKEGSICEVVEAGSNLRPWVVRCGSSVGVHGVKKVARMIAIIRRHVDPEFDPDGDSPLSNCTTSKRSFSDASEVHEWNEQRKVQRLDRYDAGRQVEETA